MARREQTHSGNTGGVSCWVCILGTRSCLLDAAGRVGPSRTNVWLSQPTRGEDDLTSMISLRSRQGPQELEPGFCGGSALLCLALALV